MTFACALNLCKFINHPAGYLFMHRALSLIYSEGHPDVIVDGMAPLEAYQSELSYLKEKVQNTNFTSYIYDWMYFISILRYWGQVVMHIVMFLCRLMPGAKSLLLNSFMTRISSSNLSMTAVKLE